MYIECHKDKLSELISKVERTTNKNSTLQILSCVLLIAKDNNLTIKATNLEVGVEMIMPVKVVKDGVIAVPASTFYQAILNTNGDKNITIEEKDGNILIRNNVSEVILKTL